MSRSRVRVAVITLALVALAVLIAVSLMRGPTSPVSSTSTPTATPLLQTASSNPTISAPSPTVPPTATPEAGAITGRLGYPSDFIPPVTVYAISTTDPRVWYSVNYAGVGNPPRPTPQPGTSGDTYTITGVAPGTYWVVAYRNDATGPMLGPDPGYYSRAAACLRIPNSGGCPDQTLIPATVIAGQTTSGIDIVVWGPPREQPLPTLPPRPTPRPQGYILPSECQFVDNGTIQGSATTWKITCPQGLPSNYLRPSLEAQGWTSCGAKVWQKSGLQIAITDAVNVTGFAGWLDQRPLGSSGCIQATPPPT